MIKSKTGWQAAMSLSCLLYATSAEAGHYVVDWQLSEFNNRRDTGSAVVVDGNDLPYVAGASGNVYGTGPSLGGQVALVAKYNQAGQRSWLTNAYPTIRRLMPLTKTTTSRGSSTRATTIERDSERTTAVSATQ